MQKENRPVEKRNRLLLCPGYFAAPNDNKLMENYSDRLKRRRLVGFSAPRRILWRTRGKGEGFSGRLEDFRKTGCRLGTKRGEGSRSAGCRCLRPTKCRATLWRRKRVSAALSRNLRARNVQNYLALLASPCTVRKPVPPKLFILAKFLWTSFASIRAVAPSFAAEI